MLPSKVEINLAQKTEFDLYTVTNLSVIEIAEYLSIKAQLIAIAKHNLANRLEELPVELTH